MALRADDKRFAPHLRHEHGPRGLAWPRLAQLLEPGDLVNCTPWRLARTARRSASLAAGVDSLRGRRTGTGPGSVTTARRSCRKAIPPNRATRSRLPLARHPCLVAVPQAVAGDDLRPVTGGHLGDRRVVLGTQGFEHGRLGVPAQFAEPPDVLGEQVVVDDARVLGSIGPDDVMVVQVLQPGPGPRLAVLPVAGALGLDHLRRHPQRRSSR